MESSQKIMAGLAAILGIFMAAPAPAAPGFSGCDDMVETRKGKVIGMAEPGGEACVYRGISFASPPVGEYRWKPPRPVRPWEGVLYAREFGDQCMQPGTEMPLDIGAGEAGMSEDCLYLNLWRPNRSGVFPVMVWIHGGDLLQGAGSRKMYWGDRLAAGRDLVVVTINYRLGPFGYLYHPDLAREHPRKSSGGYGVMDQVMALEWVRDNVAAFGGDPDRVTIMGESAGSWSVCTLLASPLARGLFHRAISQSGGCQTARTVEQGEAFGREFSQRLGCEDASCMRSRSPEEIIEALGRDWLGMLGKLQPHVDGYVLEKIPLEAIASGEYNNVPLISGSTRDEFKLWASELQGGRMAPRSTAYSAMEKRMNTGLEPGLFEMYPFKDYRRPADAMLNALGDAYLGCPCFRAAEASAIHQPLTWYYRFDYDGHLFPHMIGAAHGTELFFVFNSFDRLPARLLYTRAQEKRARPLVEIMMDYWANFAGSGDPNGAGLPAWPPYGSDGGQRLTLDLPVRSEDAGMEQKCSYWSRQEIIYH